MWPWTHGPKKEKKEGETNPVRFLVPSLKKLMGTRSKPSSKGDPTGVEIGGERNQNLLDFEVFNAAQNPGLRVQ
jgi:hypothetical protein